MGGETNAAALASYAQRALCCTLADTICSIILRSASAGGRPARTIHVRALRAAGGAAGLDIFLQGVGFSRTRVLYTVYSRAVLCCTHGLMPEIQGGTQ